MKLASRVLLFCDKSTQVHKLKLMSRVSFFIWLHLFRRIQLASKVAKRSALIDQNLAKVDKAPGLRLPESWNPSTYSQLGHRPGVAGAPFTSNCLPISVTSAAMDFNSVSTGLNCFAAML